MGLFFGFGLFSHQFEREQEDKRRQNQIKRDDFALRNSMYLSSDEKVSLNQYRTAPGKNAKK